jgi:hypothetical protein
MEILDKELYPKLTAEEIAVKRAEVDECNRVICISMKEQFNLDDIYPLGDVINYYELEATTHSIIHNIDTLGKDYINILHTITNHKCCECESIGCYNRRKIDGSPLFYKHDVYYKIKIPTSGLTYNSVFQQIKDQHIKHNYAEHYTYLDDDGDERFQSRFHHIEGFKIVEPNDGRFPTYELVCDDEDCEGDEFEFKDDPNYIERYKDGGERADEFGEYPFEDWIDYKKANLTNQSLVADIETVGHSIIILRHKIRINDDEFNNVFYYIKIPNSGLTYNNMFKQIHDQYETSNYFDKYHDTFDENDENEENEEDENIITVKFDAHERIVGFKKISAIQYDFVCVYKPNGG